MNARLRGTGYTFHGDPYEGCLWTLSTDTRPDGTRLYLCGGDNVAHTARLRFGDALREHRTFTRRYQTPKRRLASEA